MKPEIPEALSSASFLPPPLHHKIILAADLVSKAYTYNFCEFVAKIVRLHHRRKQFISTIAKLVSRDRLSESPINDFTIGERREKEKKWEDDTQRERARKKVDSEE